MPLNYQKKTYFRHVQKFKHYLHLRPFNAFSFTESSSLTINPIQDGHFRGCAQIVGGGGEAKRPPPLKICHTYPIMMKLGAVIRYLKKIQKIYESHDTPSDFC